MRRADFLIAHTCMNQSAFKYKSHSSLPICIYEILYYHDRLPYVEFINKTVETWGIADTPRKRPFILVQHIIGSILISTIKSLLIVSIYSICFRMQQPTSTINIKRSNIETFYIPILQIIDGPVFHLERHVAKYLAKLASIHL